MAHDHEHECGCGETFETEEELKAHAREVHDMDVLAAGRLSYPFLCLDP